MKQEFLNMLPKRKFLCVFHVEHADVAPPSPSRPLPAVPDRSSPESEGADADTDAHAQRKSVSTIPEDAIDEGAEALQLTPTDAAKFVDLVMMNRSDSPIGRRSGRTRSMSVGCVHLLCVINAVI